MGSPYLIGAGVSKSAPVLKCSPSRPVGLSLRRGYAVSLGLSTSVLVAHRKASQQAAANSCRSTVVTGAKNMSEAFHSITCRPTVPIPNPRAAAARSV
jgi:hypothetical protein